MNTTIWIIQGLLAAFFLMPAFTKLTSSKEKLIEKNMLNKGGNPVPIKIIGILELLGSIGIIIPLYIGFLPILTPIAAVGFALIMVGAFGVHIKRKEYKILPMLVVVFILSASVAFYRF